MERRLSVFSFRKEPLLLGRVFIALIASLLVPSLDFTARLLTILSLKTALPFGLQS